MTNAQDTTSSAGPAPTVLPPHHLMRSRLVMIGGGALGLMALINLSLWWVLVQIAEPPPDIASVGQTINAIDGRVARLEQRPSTTDLIARIDALEKRQVAAAVAASSAASPTDSKLIDRIAALEGRSTPDLNASQTRPVALEQKRSIDPQFAGQVEALSGRLEAMASRSQSAESELSRRLAATDARLTTVESATGQAVSVAQTAARLARLHRAESALAAGMPLGEIAGAPPALARFANARPPTQAELKIAFPTMENAVRAASHPDMEGKGLFDRMWDRAQGLVTVRQGDTVLLGDKVAGVLSRARNAMEAGDIAGAVAVLSALSGELARASAPWVGDAKALLDARAALADMAAKG